MIYDIIHEVKRFLKNVRFYKHLCYNSLRGNLCFEIANLIKDCWSRLRQVKDELNLSFTEFGNRLGLKKSTINAYVRGDAAPLEVLERKCQVQTP